MTQYFQSGWNIIDAFSIFTYLVTFTFHVIYAFGYYKPETPDEDDCPIMMPRVLMAITGCYSVSFLGFVVKLLHYLVIYEKIGNKVLVLKETLWDVIVFGILFVTFALTYGVLMQAILYPNETRAEKIFDGILFKSFFHVYGELFLGKFRNHLDSIICAQDLITILFQ